MNFPKPPTFILLLTSIWLPGKSKDIVTSLRNTPELVDSNIRWGPPFHVSLAPSLDTGFNTDILTLYNLEPVMLTKHVHLDAADAERSARVQSF